MQFQKCIERDCVNDDEDARAHNMFRSLKNKAEGKEWARIDIIKYKMK